MIRNRFYLELECHVPRVWNNENTPPPEPKSFAAKIYLRTPNLEHVAARRDLANFS